MQNIVKIFPSYHAYITEAILSPGTLGSNPRPFRLRFVVNKVAKVSLLVLHSPPQWYHFTNTSTLKFHLPLTPHKWQLFPTSSKAGGISHIIKKDRFSTSFPMSFIRVAAAVQFGIAVPPLPSLRPGTGPCKSGLRRKDVNECKNDMKRIGFWLVYLGPSPEWQPPSSLVSRSLHSFLLVAGWQLS